MHRRAIVRRAATATALGLAALAFVPVLEAILVAPHAVFIDHRTRTGQMFLVNNGSVPEEVSIEVKFGYPDSDSLGGVYIKLIDAPDSTMPSSAAWVRAFPRRTVVQPGERQTVRLLAQPPLGLPDGEFWSRLIVTSREVRPAPVASDTLVRAGVDMQIRTILPLSYRKGPLRTSVTMTEFQPELRGDSMSVWLGLHRDGNAAWIGRLQLEAHDQGGRRVGSYDGPVAVYFAVRRRFAFAIEGARAGAVYRLRLRLSTDRDDVRREDVLRSAPIADSVLVRAQ